MLHIALATLELSIMICVQNYARSSIKCGCWRKCCWCDLFALAKFLFLFFVSQF